MIAAIQKQPENKSAVVKAIEARARATKIVPINMVVAILAEPVHKIAFRVNVKSEERDAIDKAHKTINETVATDSAKSDPDILSDEKLIGALWHACREVKTTRDAIGAEHDEVTIYPAFPSPRWMGDHLTTDQIAVLVNMYNAVRVELGPMRAFDADAADGVLNVLASLDSEGVPGVALAAISREGLVQLLSHASKALAGARAALAEQEGVPEGHRMVDVEHACLIRESAARFAEQHAYTAGIRDTLKVLRGEAPSTLLAPPEPE